MGDYGAIKEIDALSKATWASWNGWYLDLPAVGERLLARSTMATC